jgi:hypothetical protein
MQSINDSDEEGSSADVSDKAKQSSETKKVKYANLVEECTTFLNIATFLTSLSIPMDMTKSFPHLQSYYNGLPQEYIHRIPFWELLKQPWVILEPLMNDSTELSSKLTPICAYLKLERDEYYVKRTMNLYAKCMSGLIGMSADSIAVEYDKVLAMVGDVASYVKNPIEQVKVWQKLYDLEKGRYSDVALRCLESAHRVLDAPIPAECEAEVEGLRKNVLEDIVKHKCRAVLHKLDYDHKRFMFTDSTTASAQSSKLLANRFGNSLGDLNTVIKMLLEYTVENAWVLQLRYVRNTNSILCCLDVMGTFHLPIISEFVRRMGAAIHAISQHHELLGVAPTSPTCSSPSPTPLQLVTHAMIGRLLADADIQKESSDQRVMMSASEKGGQTALGGAGGWGGGGAWGSANSGVSPSLAETRRRDDLFKAFAISVLVASCSELSHRYSECYFDIALLKF